jgi:membrane-associated phospholipid phosphatase
MKPEALGVSPEAQRKDDNLSFYSGHTSLTFTLATASGTVASLRGYSLAPAIWSAGLGVAALAGWLRIAADKHYLSDVLVGAVAGSLAGVLLPVLFHGRRDPVAGPVIDPTAAGQ